MNDDEAFVEALAASPNDDTLRLVYADWLEEHGYPHSIITATAPVVVAGKRSKYNGQPPALTATPAIPQRSRSRVMARAYSL